MAVRYSNPFTRYLTDNIKSLPGGKLNFFEPGSTTIRKDTFSDEAGENANSNPVVLDASGRIPDIFLDGTYGVTLTNKDDVEIDAADPVGGDITGGSFADWNPAISYSIGDLVTGSDGKRYESLTNSNLNNDPTTPNLTDWEEVQFLGIYNVNITYAINDTVKASNGLLYTSLTASNLNNDPLTDTVNWAPASDLTTEAFASVSLYSFDNFFGF